MANKINCASCKYAQKDKKASEYSVKHCGKCESRADCEVCRDCKNRDACKVRRNPSLKQTCDRRFETVCNRQTLRWMAYECVNRRSDYHKALLNVTVNGDKQAYISWAGCARGERRCGE
jgi:hypothetical protein